MYSISHILLRYTQSAAGFFPLGIQFAQLVIPMTNAPSSWKFKYATLQLPTQFYRIHKHKKSCACIVAILLTTDTKWMLGGASTLAVVCTVI